MEVQYTLPNIINVKSINLTPTGYTMYLPSGDKRFSRFQKAEKPYLLLKGSKYFQTQIKHKQIQLEPYFM